jgi:hypothetical protein
MNSISGAHAGVAPDMGLGMGMGLGLTGGAGMGAGGGAAVDPTDGSVRGSVGLQSLRDIFDQYAERETDLLGLGQLQELLLSHGLSDKRIQKMNASAIKTFPLLPDDLFDGSVGLTFKDFEATYQVCKRCTDLKRKKCQSNSSYQAISSASNAQTVTLDSAVNSVIVRKMPTNYVGDPIRSCNHFQWTWCPGLPNNPKCQVCRNLICYTVVHLRGNTHPWPYI